MWIAHIKWLVQDGRHKEANALVKRSMLSLPQHKQLEVMSKFAQFEYEFGSAERGRTVMEGLVEQNPKKLDLWYVFVDREVKVDLDFVRILFKKMIGANFNDRAMKSTFKKWLKIEQKLVDLDIAVKTSLHLETPVADEVSQRQPVSLCLYSNPLYLYSASPPWMS